MEKNNKASLSATLTYGLLQFPQLLADLPAMISAMEAGESVNIDAISDVHFRSYLQSLFPLLPVRKIGSDGYIRDPSVQSIGSTLLHLLLEAKSIVQPTELSHSQSLSSRTAPLAFLSLLQKFPSLRDEFPVLLDMLIDGQTACLSGLSNVEMREGLENILESLGCRQLSGNDFDDDSDDDEGSGSGLAVPIGKQTFSVFVLFA
jgi:hypothetical protein